MSSGFQVDVGELDHAAAKLAVAAGKARDVNIAGAFDPIDNALPSSELSAASLWISTRLAASAQVWANHLDRASEALTRSAESYRRADQSSHDLLGGPR